ncbi:MAG TPA: hypothetical protein VJT73_14550 [Polyangiaceae bacterium]|nr:hypothetical protein [Polyangiaceae bacterium]
MLATGRSSWAKTGDIATRVDCPALSSDARAEFEARAQVDLSLRSRGGDLSVVCDGLQARVRWQPRGGGIYERPVPRAPDAAILLDTLLVAVADVVGDANAAEKVLPTEVDAGTEIRAAPGADPAKNGQDPERRQPSEGRAAGSPEGASPDRAEPRSRFVVIPKTFGALLGAYAGLLTTHGTGAVGPHVGVLAGFGSGIVGTLVGEYGTGFGGSSDIQVETLGGALLVGKWWGETRAWETAVGASLTNVKASASNDPSTAESKTLVSAVARARYALVLDGWRYAIGPDVRLTNPYLDVTFDGSVVWNIPALTAGLTLDITARIYGSAW